MHDDFPVHRLNLFAYNLMNVYQIRSYDDIYSISWRFLTIKQIGHKYYSKILNICIPTSVKTKISQALNFQLSYFSYIRQVSVFYINAKTKLVQIFVTLEKGFTKTL